MSSFASAISSASTQASSAASSSGGSPFSGGRGSAAAQAFVALAEGFFAQQSHNANAKSLGQQARQREIEGVALANDRARSGRAAVATGIAIAGASGFTTDGSATDVLARMAAEAETASARALYEGLRDGDQLRHRARLQKYQGKQAMAAGIIRASAAFL